MYPLRRGIAFPPPEQDTRENGNYRMDHMNLEAILNRVGAAADRSGRDPAEIVVVAVGKTFPPEKLMEAYEAGHRDFGENRAQELTVKVPALPPDIRWHFIGPLQRNKVRVVRPAATLLHSMDRLALGEAWLKGPGAPPPVLVEINIGEEPQKAGVEPDRAPALIGALTDLGLDVRGLMTIPPQVEHPDDARRYFEAMRLLRDRLGRDHPGIRELSMGMTDDFEVAIEEGATLVRVGRAIFGARNR